MRKTKIICTLGPATESADVLHAMIAAGANIFRLNMSHATHEGVRAMVPRIRGAARDAGKVIAILMDVDLFANAGHARFSPARPSEAAATIPRTAIRRPPT